MTTANIIITVLLAINTFLLGMFGWFLKRSLDKNDDDHENFYNRTNGLNDRLIVIETEHKKNHG
jgi:hypothetical protein